MKVRAMARRKKSERLKGLTLKRPKTWKTLHLRSRTLKMSHFLKAPHSNVQTFKVHHEKVLAFNFFYPKIRKYQHLNLRNLLR